MTVFLARPERPCRKVAPGRGPPRERTICRTMKSSLSGLPRCLSNRSAVGIRTTVAFRPVSPSEEGILGLHINFLSEIGLFGEKLSQEKRRNFRCPGQGRLGQAWEAVRRPYS